MGNIKITFTWLTCAYQKSTQILTLDAQFVFRNSLLYNPASIVLNMKFIKSVLNHT